MAGTMIHLVIADILRRDIENTVVTTPYGQVQIDGDYFLAGNICPDGIMARKDYVRDMKMHTHFRDGIKDSEFYKEENLKVFDKRLDEFMVHSFANYQDNKMRSLYFGYFIHMLTDRYFILSIRPHFFEKIASIGLTQYDTESFRYFSHDVDMIDFKLVREYKGSDDIYRILKNIEPYEIKDMITKEELTDSRNWILSYFFETEHEYQPPGFLSYETMEKFIYDMLEGDCLI